jgi:hypothetical protein
MVIYNGDQLVKVVINDRKQDTDLEWRPFKKSFWGNQKEGFYNRYSICNTVYTADELRNGELYGIKLIVDYQTVYYKPNVKLHFANKDSFTKVFNSYEEALSWGKAIAQEHIKAQIVIE